MSEQPAADLPRETNGTVRRVALVVYSSLAAGLTGVALYMAFVAEHKLTSAYVAAPAIGALWFGLRLFMILGSRR